MLRWLSFFGAVALVAAGVVFYLYQGVPPTFFKAPEPGVPQPAAPEAKQAQAAPVKAVEAAAPAAPGPWTRVVAVAPNVVISGARLNAIEAPQVPGMRNGQLLFLATEIQLRPGESPPAGAFKQVIPSLVTEVTERKPDETQGPDWVVIDNKWYRPLQKSDEARPNKLKLYRGEKWFVPLDEGTHVKEGQILAVLDPALAVDDLSIRLAKLDAAEADRLASEKIREFYKEHLQREIDLQRRGAATVEEVAEARASYDRYAQEVISKAEAVKVAGKELRQAETILEFHIIRSKIDGQVKQLIRHKGESVKELDPVLEMVDISKLRIRGRADLQDLDFLKPGAEVDVEATRLVAPERVLTGHMGDVTGVAVSKDGQVVSVSDDRTARVWEKDLARRSERLVLRHPAAVRAVACTPARAEDRNLCVTGAADGVARLYDLAAEGDHPLVRELRDANGHKEAINSVAFSPDGKWAVTGGDDRAICLWDVDSGALKSRFSKDDGHRGAITSVAFLPVGADEKLRVVSAGRDNALIVWPLSAEGTPEKAIRLDRRGGEVTTLGVSANDGGKLLFDQGKELRVLSATNGALLGSLSATGGSSFSKLALFSPQGNLVLTSGGGGRLHLWRAPTAKGRGHELEQLVWTSGRDEQAATSSGAFAPDGKFLVTGTHNRNVIVWPMPEPKDVERRLTARIVTNDPEVTSGQVRVTAELVNPGYLLPGDAVTLVVYPQK